MDRTEYLQKQIIVLHNVTLEIAECVAKSLPGDLPYNLQCIAEAQCEAMNNLEAEFKDTQDE